MAKGRGFKGSGGGTYHSAISNRYVTSARGKRSPKTAVKEGPGARARGIKLRLRDEDRSSDDSTEIVRRDREPG